MYTTYFTLSAILCVSYVESRGGHVGDGYGGGGHWRGGHWGEGRSGSYSTCTFQNYTVTCSSNYCCDISTIAANASYPQLCCTKPANTTIYILIGLAAGLFLLFNAILLGILCYRYRLRCKARYTHLQGSAFHNGGFVHPVTYAGDGGAPSVIYSQAVFSQPQVDATYLYLPNRQISNIYT